MANLGPLREIDGYCVGDADAKDLPAWLWERVGIDVHVDKDGPSIMVDGPEGRAIVNGGEFIFRLPDGTLGTVKGLTPETVRHHHGQLKIERISGALPPKPSD